MAKKTGIIRGMFKKAANYYVTVVSPASDQFASIFGNVPNLSDASIIANFETIPDLFLITNYLAGKMASIPVKVVGPDGTVSERSELNRLVKRPNQYQSWKQLVKLFFAYYEPLGNSYFYGIKPDGLDQVSSLYVLPTDKTKIVLLRDKSIPAWMNEIAGYQCTIGNKLYNLQPEMVMHSRYISLRYDDGSWVYGMSKYIPGDKVNRELKAIHDAKTSIIEERGALGFVTNESEVPDPVQSALVRDRLSSKYGLKDGQDKVIVTTEKLRWEQMALGIQELQLIENAKYSFNKMCQLNEFDPVIFSTEGSTFANKEVAVKELMQKVVRPRVDEFYISLNAFIGAGYNGDQILPDWDQVPEVQVDRKAMTDIFEKQVGSALITPYGAAKLLYGDRVDDNPPPDEYYRKTSLVPVITPEGEEPVEEILPEIDPEMIRALVAEQAADDE